MCGVGGGDVGRGGKRENIVTQIDTSKSLVTTLLKKWEPPTEHVFYFTVVAAIRVFKINVPTSASIYPDKVRHDRT